LDIFCPFTWTKPLCIQVFAITGVLCAQRLCAISFSWCGKMRSMPPPWMSNTSPSIAPDMAEHSMCHPGRPRPQGESQPGWSDVLGFHSTKSAGCFL
jgi:hypothetical protein